MRLVLIAALVALAAGGAALWAFGGFEQVAAWAAERQRETQNALARGLRALRSGQPGALAALMGLCFAYGFFHAAGPGHGKVVIGGYGLGSRVAARRLVAISLAASLAQAATAVALVYAGVRLFQWTRERMVGVAEDLLAPASYAAIAAIGAWLMLRGVLRLRRAGAAGSPDHPHRHDQDGHHRDRDGDHHDHGPECGHRHGPTAEEVARVSGWRDAAALIAGIAVRPCTGAIFVLVLTWGMGIPLAGIAGAFVIGLGTASVTILVALAAVWFRDGVRWSLADGGVAGRAVPVLEIMGGLVVVLAALGLLSATL